MGLEGTVLDSGIVIGGWGSFCWEGLIVASACDQAILECLLYLFILFIKSLNYKPF